MKKSNKFTIICFMTFIIFGLTVLCFSDGYAKGEKKLGKKYKKWIDEEVVYIISQNEKEVFKSFATDELREEFIKTFWNRRDPTPETPFNEFREEHYRRIEFANKKYFEGIAGWRSDRGRVYIMFGPPDFFESNPGGGRGFLFDVSGPTAEFPAEKWMYRYIPGLKLRKSRIEFMFVNHYNSGKYQLVTNPALANALRNTSIPSRNIGFEDPSGAIPGETDRNLSENPLEQLQMMAELTKSRGEVFEEMARSTRLRKLKGIVDARESLSEMPFFLKEYFFLGKNNRTSIGCRVEIAGKYIAFKKKANRYDGDVHFCIEINYDRKIVSHSIDRLVMSLR